MTIESYGIYPNSAPDVLNMDGAEWDSMQAALPSCHLMMKDGARRAWVEQDGEVVFNVTRDEGITVDLLKGSAT